MQRLGIINFLFWSGAGGTYLANTLAHTIIDPWYDTYVPQYPNASFERVNEYATPWMHVAGVWHPNFLKPEVDKLSNTKWVMIDLTRDEYYFSNVINTVKSLQKGNIDIEQSIPYIRNTIDMNLSKQYVLYSDDMIDLKYELQERNTVEVIKYSDLLSDAKPETFEKILDMIYHGHRNECYNLCEHIANHCKEKHQRDVKLFDEIIHDQGLQILQDLISIKES